VDWIDINHKQPKGGEIIEAFIRHVNLDLNLADTIVIGYMGDDNFYFLEGGELSWNWDIIKWKKHERERKIKND